MSNEPETATTNPCERRRNDYKGITACYSKCCLLH
jgi:hypothetical protein